MGFLPQNHKLHSDNLWGIMYVKNLRLMMFSNNLLLNPHSNNTYIIHLLKSSFPII